jgi:predicted ATPase
MLPVRTRGQAAPEVGEAYDRARTLSQRLGETTAQFYALLGLAGFHMVRGELRAARELGEQLVNLAQVNQDATQLVSAHMSLGLPLFWQGEFTRAHEQLERAVEIYTVYKDAPAVFRAKQDRWVLFFYSAGNLWHLGYPDQAMIRANESIALAHDLDDPISVAVVSDYAAFLGYFQQNSRVVQERSAAAVALSTELGLPYWLAIGTILNGWAEASLGSADGGVAQIKRGLLAYRETGAGLLLPHWCAILADAYGKAGHPEEGLTVLGDGLAVLEKTGERNYEAELYRLKGQLMLQNQAPSSRVPPVPPNRDAVCDAQKCFLSAIEIADRQHANLLKLRAAVSLAGLWQHSRRREARELLSGAYRWFTEGFDTTDLQEAKLLLESLRQ